MAYRVTFNGQAWLNDAAIFVDQEQNNTFMIPALPDGIHEDDDTFDDLQRHPNAPDWIRDWQGPFEMSIDTVDDSEFTLSMMDHAVLRLADRLFSIGSRLISYGFSHLDVTYRAGDEKDPTLAAVNGMIDTVMHTTLGIDAGRAHKRFWKLADGTQALGKFTPFTANESEVMVRLDVTTACVNVAHQFAGGEMTHRVKRAESCAMALLREIELAADTILPPDQMPRGWRCAPPPEPGRDDITMNNRASAAPPQIYIVTYADKYTSVNYAYGTRDGAYAKGWDIIENLFLDRDREAEFKVFREENDLFGAWNAINFFNGEFNIIEADDMDGLIQPTSETSPAAVTPDALRTAVKDVVCEANILENQYLATEILIEKVLWTAMKTAVAAAPDDHPLKGIVQVIIESAGKIGEDKKKALLKIDRIAWKNLSNAVDGTSN